MSFLVNALEKSTCHSLVQPTLVKSDRAELPSGDFHAFRVRQLKPHSAIGFWPASGFIQPVTS